MPAHLSRRAPRAITAGLAGCAMTLALAAPGSARPMDAGLAHPCADCGARPVVHATLGTGDPAPDRRGSAPTGSLAGTTSARSVVNAPGTDVAAPDQQSPIPAPGSGPTASPVREHPRVVPVDGGATTLAIVAIAAGALLAGAGAGFAGGRRMALRAG